MENFDRKKHWENIYHTKTFEGVSWYQPVPVTSLEFVEQFHVPKTAKIIDVGGGESHFVDSLLDQGYQDVTVLDISEAAIEKTKQRLGARASKIKFIVADIAYFTPEEKYDFWHDRATFHFLTDEVEISQYLKTVRNGINPEGVLVIGTFSEQGPKKCSGIDVRQYSEKSMAERLKKYFKKIRCITVNHRTPFDTVQNFIFCSFKKLTFA
jgi:trans-aconitate methyltransferase